MIFVCFFVCIRKHLLFYIEPEAELGFFFFFFLVLISSCFSVVCYVVALSPYNGQIKR